MDECLWVRRFSFNRTFKKKGRDRALFAAKVVACAREEKDEKQRENRGLFGNVICFKISKKIDF